MSIPQVLANVRRLGVETSPYIYYLEANPAFVHVVTDIFDFVENNALQITTSTIALTETLMKPLQSGDTSLAKAYRELFMQTAYVRLVAVTPAIAEQAAGLRARYNLRTADSLHVASAIESTCQAFLTNDLTLKRVKEIPVLVLKELL